LKNYDQNQRVSNNSFALIKGWVTGLLLLLASGAFAQGTLSGTVVDAADDSIPVYPVAIDLLEPDTGAAIEEFAVTNNPDGSYEISGIPAGEYKISFNAVDAASGYVDELYDGVPCDNIGCDRITLGDVMVISDGANFLDIDLDRVFLLSGTITDELNQPIYDVGVELFDESGNWIC
jgi:hypothetical protein